MVSATHQLISRPAPVSSSQPGFNAYSSSPFFLFWCRTQHKPGKPANVVDRPPYVCEKSHVCGITIMCDVVLCSMVSSWCMGGARKCWDLMVL